MLSDGVKSSFLDITKGVLQGSILGAVLFTIYLNIIGLCIKSSNIHLYANDTVMYAIAPTVDKAKFELQSDFVILQKALD